MAESNRRPHGERQLDESHPPQRGRNAAVTRQAILSAGKSCFMRDGYEQVGVRDIAARAGVDPALVIRYFGSKEGLFAEAVITKFDLSELFTGDLSTLGERLARGTLQKKKPPHEEFDPMLALLRSASSDIPAKMLRHAIEEGFVRPLAARLAEPDATARAELVGSTLLGLLFLRKVIRVTDGDDERLIALVAPMLQALIDGKT